MMFTTLLALLYGLISFAKSDTTYCYNEDACEDEDIDTTNVDCYGYYGCEYSNLTCSYAYDFGAYSNYDSSNNDEYIWSYGLLSNYYSDISTYAIYSYGYLSTYEADIEPLSSTLYAYFYGYYSGYHADVKCYSGDICRVYCGRSFGCADLDFYCYSGAYCFYDCANDTDYCPTLYSGVAAQIEYNTGLDELEEAKILNGKLHTGLTDDEITAIYNQDNAISEKKKDSENLEELISTLQQVGGKNGKPGYAPLVETPENEIEINSLNEHMDRLEAKAVEFEQVHGIETKIMYYVKACVIDGVALFVLFALYKMFLGKGKNGNKQIIDSSEDTPLMNNEKHTTTVVL